MKKSVLFVLLLSLSVGAVCQKNPFKRNQQHLKDGVTANWIPSGYYQYTYDGSDYHIQYDHKLQFDGYFMTSDILVDSATQIPISKTEYVALNSDRVERTAFYYDGSDWLPIDRSTQVNRSSEGFSNFYKHELYDNGTWTRVAYDSALVFEDNGFFAGHEGWSTNGTPNIELQEYSTFTVNGNEATWEFYSSDGNGNFNLEMTYDVEYENGEPKYFTAEGEDFRIVIESWLDPLEMIPEEIIYQESNGTQWVNVDRELTLEEEGVFSLNIYYEWAGNDWELIEKNLYTYNPLTGAQLSSTYTESNGAVYGDTLHITSDADGRVLEEILINLQGGVETIMGKRVYYGHLNSVSNAASTQNFRIAPNPTLGQLQFPALNAKGYIYHTDGRKVAELNSGTTEFNLANQPQGVYFFIVPDMNILERIVKE